MRWVARPSNSASCWRLRRSFGRRWLRFLGRRLTKIINYGKSNSWVIKGEAMTQFRALGAAAISFTLIACANTEYRWRHSNLSGPTAQQQFNSDQAICAAEAHRTAGPAPQAPQLPPNTTTTFHGQTSRGTTFQGNASTTHSEANPIWSGFEQGRADARHQNTVAALFNGCMTQLGWSQHRVTR